MRNKYALSVIYLFFAALLFPGFLSAQGQSSIDAVSISGKYYNSIVKVLLYDSVMAKTNPDKAYLGRGSGFFVSEDGYIFTNRHVINMTYGGFCRYQTYNEEEKKYEDNFGEFTEALLRDPNVFKITYVGRASVIVQVFTNARGDSSKLYHAQIIALDTMHFDGAILKINTDLAGRPVTDKFHPLPLGNSDSIKQGQDLCLFGFPAQYGGTFDVMLKDLSTLILGKHSGYDYRYNSVFGFIKTDAAINNGNSGGPVFGPANNVIGLATAAFEKTNVGLIGGIDAMFYVSALIPDLQKELTAKGFKAPSNVPTFITTSLYKPEPLPSAKDIKRANNRSNKKGMEAARAFFVMSLSYGLAANNTYTVPAYSDAVYTVKGGTYNVPSTEFSVNFRIVKPTFLKQTNNLVGYFFNVAPGIFVPNWQTTTPITSKAATIVMNSSDFGNSEPNVSIAFGFSYTYLFNRSLSIGVYYGPSMDFEPANSGTSGGISIGKSTLPGISSQDINYTRDVTSFVQTTGFVFKAKALWLGFDYKFGSKVNVQYYLPTDPSLNNSNNTTVQKGVSTRSLFSATLGVAL